MSPNYRRSRATAKLQRIEGSKALCYAIPHEQSPGLLIVAAPNGRTHRHTLLTQIGAETSPRNLYVSLIQFTRTHFDGEHGLHLHD